MPLSSSPVLPVVFERRGSGSPVLVLHGGGGPASVAAIVDHLSHHHDVIAPVIPGWNGTDRPDWLTDIDDVALAFLDLLRELGLRDVAVIGSSIGGWIAGAMAVFDVDGGRIGRLCLVDAVGIDVPRHPIRDFFALDAREIAEYSFHDADRFFVDPATLTDAQRATTRENMATMRVVAGDMTDPRLIHRLARVTVPTLVVWGDSDRIVTPEYGQVLAEAFPDGRFELIRDAGHLPHIERPEPTFAVIDAFVAG